MSFGLQPNDKSVELAVRLGSLPAWAHPERVYWQWEWIQIRDGFQGEIEVKRKNDLYLRKLEGMTRKEYKAYLERAVFFNMIKPTTSKFIGSLFRRPAKLTALPARLPVTAITREGIDLVQYGRLVAQEQVLMGRVGALLDMDPAGIKAPYISTYIAENIMDWAYQVVEGRVVLSDVVLREIREDRNDDWQVRTYRAQYRRLKLVQDPSDDSWFYTQYVYDTADASGTITAEPTETIVPTRNGVPFSFIPFVFFGALSNQPSVESSPLYDIAKLNFSHYRTYAHLEHGRNYTALPIYYVPTGEGDEKGEYEIGPSVVWQVAPGQKPGILEFHGQGLMTLERALSEKERQIESIGGKLMDSGGKTGQSDKVVQSEAANETSVLLALALVHDQGMTQLLRWMAWWMGCTDAEVAALGYETNKSFVFDNTGAREFRAIQSMYLDGVIPVEVVYDYLLRAEVIPDWMDLNTFTGYLKSASH